MDDIKKTLKAIENGLSSIGGGEIDNAVYVDDADWTDNTSKHLNVGGVYQSSPHTVTDGDVTPFLTDVNGRQDVRTRPDGYATDDSAMPATPVTMPISGEYRASATTYTDGDTTVLQTDVNGNTKTVLATQIAGENLTDDTLGVSQKPVVSSSYSGTAFTDLGALAKDNEKAAAAQLLAIHAQNENAAVRYLQIFNLAADPTDDSSVPVLSFVIPAGSGTAPGITSIGRDFFGEGGYYLSTGFSWGISVDPDVFDETGVTVGEHQVNGLYI